MTDANVGAMRRSLTLTGVTVNAMALIAPGAFLWTTFETQAALSRHGTSTADGMWAGLLLALVLAMLTAYSYAELARIYPDAGTGSSYYFAEAAFLDKERPSHQRYARFAKLSVGWISHLYYWIYPGHHGGLHGDTVRVPVLGDLPSHVVVSRRSGSWPSPSPARRATSPSGASAGRR